MNKEELCKQAGVSIRLFDQWRGDRLLPRPTRVGTTKRGGSAWDYPEDTLPVLLCLKELRYLSRDEKVVRLWLKGHPVEPEIVRLVLSEPWRQAVAEVEQIIANFDGEFHDALAVAETFLPHPRTSFPELAVWTYAFI
jgi:hypothetical protein